MKFEKLGTEGDSSSVYNLINFLSAKGCEGNIVYEVHDPRELTKDLPHAEFINRSLKYYEAFTNPQLVDKKASTNISYAAIIDGKCYLALNTGSNTYLGTGPTSTLNIRKFCFEKKISIEYVESDINIWVQAVIQKKQTTNKKNDSGMLHVDLGIKLNGTNLYEVIEDNWDKSFNAKIITFHFNRTEWIANSEVAFVFSWIRLLVSKKIKVVVELQSIKDIKVDSIQYKRRKYCLEKLNFQHKLKTVLPQTTEFIEGGVEVTSQPSESFSEMFPLPIIKYNTQSFDNDFEQIYSNNFGHLKKSYEAFLGNTNLNYYDTKFLNYSFLKELYSNVCLHSNSEVSGECFCSIAINKRYREESDFVSKARIEELTPLETHFYVEKGNYRNIDYIEINFHDFGLGISQTLKSKYEAESEESLKKYFGTGFKEHQNQNIDTKIIQYSLLLFTSKFEIDRNFEVHDFIPRGLFILLEIVKKYNGYLEVVSQTGGLGISFKDADENISYVRPSNKKTLFPGTKIKIVFPSKTQEKSKEAKKETYLLEKSNSHYSTTPIHFLKLYSDVENKILDESDSKASLNPDIRVTIFAAFFTELLAVFTKHPKNQIFLIDFAGIESSTLDLFNKFIYFISHSPITSNYKIILCNLNTKGLNSTVIFDLNKGLKSKGFYSYPVPSISTDLNIEWLGVDETDNTLFTDLWKGDTSKEYTVDDLAGFHSSMISSKQDGKRNKISVNLPLFETICEEIDKNISEVIKNEISNKGIQFFHLKDEKKNYNDVLIEKEKTFFLSSNGSYQKRYLSFNEKLYVLAYRKMIGNYFSFKLFNDNKLNPERITKIISVTLSSQFIGNEVKEILNNLLNKEIDLIALSNYYNFQNEDRFNDIKGRDNVLVVNDTISTGNLTENIFQSIERKNATPIACLSIVDLRNEQNSNFDYPIKSLSNFTIEKLKKRPVDSLIEWINPVLNVPVSMPSSKSNAITLFSQEEFLNEIDEKYVIVGNLKSNSNYLNYFLNTSELLKDDFQSGFKLIKQLLSRLKEKKKENNYSELSAIKKGLKIISGSIIDQTSINELSRIDNILEELNEKSLFESYNVDIVFYPFLSKISLVENDSTIFIDSSLSSSLPIIYPIPRIMTPDGWRFSFPPKFLNILTAKKNMSALIIDDGSCTGDTIMQMIDSISFLSIKSMDVLSIFVRLEDFQKELLSRVKSVKVKNNVVPLNVHFGVHFNLPVYNSNENPANIELKEIEDLEFKFKISNNSFSDNFDSFLDERKKVLKNFKLPINQEFEFVVYKEIPRKELMKFRDFLGRYDTYRFYTEDIPSELNTDFLIKDDVAILTLLTVLNIEPRLYQTIKRIFPSDKINAVRTKILTNYLSKSELNNCEEKQIFLLKSLFNLDHASFLKSQNLLELSEILFVNNFSANSYRYVTYILFLVGLKIKNINDVLATKAFDVNVMDFGFSLNSKNADVYGRFRFFFEIYGQLREKGDEQLKENLPVNKFFKLSEYYHRVVNNEKSHDKKLLPNHFNDLEKNISELLVSMTTPMYKEEIEFNKKSFLIAFESVKQNYFKEFDEYRIIKDLIVDLKKYSNMDMLFNPSSLYDVILRLETALNNIEIDIASLELLKTAITEYKNSFLLLGSEFLKFVLNQKCNIETVWQQCEKNFSEQDYLQIKLGEQLKHNVKVNPYILRLTFDNLLSNKVKYAKNTVWEMYAKDNNSSLDLYIKQDSSFIKDKGEGTGQQNIKSILRNYGTLYRKIQDNPYTIKITFDK